MTSKSTSQRNRQLALDAATHLYAVGQAVHLTDGFARSAKSTDIYRVTGTLPPVGNSPQYRVRNDDERYERVTTQDNLEPANIQQPGENTTLIERTFGHGQGTEAQ